ncbi:hypothetical protein CVT26_014480 [Gymnopilus dilepis]|uniref:Uncharacterized protein n=1 Tax=Gymnopilus dilepis TaxID=231916 RepID=A0A409VVG3_9AGAR|nr:hypothetical protein CVT26_014480 [Gymnopilus dilepis]
MLSRSPIEVTNPEVGQPRGVLVEFEYQDSVSQRRFIDLPRRLSFLQSVNGSNPPPTVSWGYWLPSFIPGSTPLLAPPSTLLSHLYLALSFPLSSPSSLFIMSLPEPLSTVYYVYAIDFNCERLPSLASTSNYDLRLAYQLSPPIQPSSRSLHLLLFRGGRIMSGYAVSGSQFQYHLPPRGPQVSEARFILQPSVLSYNSAPSPSRAHTPSRRVDLVRTGQRAVNSLRHRFMEEPLRHLPAHTLASFVDAERVI